MLAALASVVCIQTAFAAPRHGDFTELLQRFVVAEPDGATRVEYARWAADEEARAELERYINSLESQDLFAIEDRDAQFAAWANLYNALTLKVVLDAYPVDSIRQIRSSLISPGPWKRDLAVVAGRDLSLDDIEHDILRGGWSDPRVHYAVNCASIGCPDLQPAAWEADTLDADLDAAASNYVNHPRGVTVLKDGRLRLSSIYRWFRTDFGGDEAGVIAHLERHAAPELAMKLRQSKGVAGYDYDWSLNEVERRAP